MENKVFDFRHGFRRKRCQVLHFQIVVDVNIVLDPDSEPSVLFRDKGIIKRNVGTRLYREDLIIRGTSKRRCKWYHSGRQGCAW